MLTRLPLRRRLHREVGGRSRELVDSDCVDVLSCIHHHYLSSPDNQNYSRTSQSSIVTLIHFMRHAVSVYHPEPGLTIMACRALESAPWHNSSGPEEPMSTRSYGDPITQLSGCRAAKAGGRSKWFMRYHRVRRTNCCPRQLPVQVSHRRHLPASRRFLAGCYADVFQSIAVSAS